MAGVQTAELSIFIIDSTLTRRRDNVDLLLKCVPMHFLHKYICMYYHPLNDQQYIVRPLSIVVDR